MVVVQNTAPWTYLGARPIHACPDASFDTGIDVFGLLRLRTISTARHVRQLLSPGAQLKGRDVVTRHDLAEMSVWASRPTAVQLDGEPVGDRVSVRFISHPEADHGQPVL